MHRRRRSIGGDSRRVPRPSDMRGKVVVITGGNTGIGYATAKTLAVLGAHVIIACRSEKRAVAAIHQMKEEVCSESPHVLVEYMHLDLSSLDSVKRFSTTLRERNQSLHVLINNAGISWAHYGLTRDGFEQHYQVNHLGHFLLTLELLPLLLSTAEASGDCRVVFVASRRHVHGVFNPGNMNGELSYSRYTFYNNSKLYNVMTAYALQRRLRYSGITVSSLHPGLVDTEISRNMTDMLVASTFVKALKALSVGWKSAEKGAATSVYVATEPDLNSQQCYYYADCRAKQSSATSRNEELQEQLWDVCMRDVKKYTSPETRRKYSTTTQSPRDNCSLQSARRHAFRSSVVRHKPEDREELIESTAQDSESDEEWSEEGEELR